MKANMVESNDASAVGLVGQEGFYAVVYWGSIQDLASFESVYLVLGIEFCPKIWPPYTLLT